QIEVEWGMESSGEFYPAKLLVKSTDRIGLLADVAAHITRSGANILSAKTETKKNQSVDGYFIVLVRNTEQLSNTIEELRQVRQVLEVVRLS
ncbi:ACT domain-containing protein, partial [Desulfosarcina sp. OttesenSCG-928-A07]|nr:ACT domain-containing protein [Desulfosarcina sp. OttesenSCG-928-A07]